MRLLWKTCLKGANSPSGRSIIPKSSVNFRELSRGPPVLTLPPCTFDKTPLLPVLQADQPKQDTPKRRHTYKLFPSSQPARIISPIYGVDVLHGDIQARDYTVVLPRLRETQNNNSFNSTPPLGEENRLNNTAIKRGNSFQGNASKTDADLKVPRNRAMKQGDSHIEGMHMQRETRPANKGNTKLGDYCSRASNTRYCSGTNIHELDRGASKQMGEHTVST